MTRAVWVTRPAPAGARSERALQAAGVSAVWVPVLRVSMAESVDWPEKPDWIVFTSGNGVRAWLNAGSPGVDTARLAAVGQQTAALIRKHHGRPVDVPDRERMSGLQDLMEAQQLEGRSIALPHGDHPEATAPELGARLSSRGARVWAAPVYTNNPKTLSPDELHRLSRWKPGGVVLYSSSGAEAWHAAARGDLASWKKAPVVAIGPATASKLSSLGYVPRIAASPDDTSVIHMLHSLNLGVSK